MLLWGDRVSASLTCLPLSALTVHLIDLKVPQLGDQGSDSPSSLLPTGCTNNSFFSSLANRGHEQWPPRGLAQSELIYCRLHCS